MRNALNNVQITELEVYGSAVGGSMLRGKKGVEGGGVYFGRNWVSSTVQQVSDGVERAKAAVLPEVLLATVMGELLSGEWLSSFVKCVRAQRYVGGLRVFRGDVPMVFAKLRLISGGVFLAWKITLELGTYSMLGELKDVSCVSRWLELFKVLALRRNC